MKKRVVLAYSGGLDTTLAIPWIKENYGYDVIALLIDVGAASGLNEAKERAFQVGAEDCVIVDAVDEFAEKYILPVLQAGALYEGKYPLVSALSRPLIAYHQVKVAQERGAGAVGHGCTGKGNDQVRFALSSWALNPDLEILAPIRDWGMSREESIEYAKEKNIPIPVTKKSPYSIDVNLWGRAIECGPLEDPWNQPPEECFALTVSPENAPDEPQILEIEFKSGKPVAIDGVMYPLAELIDRLNKIAGGHGVGRIDMVENRLVGIKSREVYEAPAAMTLLAAHRELEDLVFDRDVLRFKQSISEQYAELAYYGKWFSPLKSFFDKFIAETQAYVSGTVKMKLFKGHVAAVGRKADNSLYDYGLATYDLSDKFSHRFAEGFVELWGLPLKVWTAKHRPKGGPNGRWGEKGEWGNG